ncbi:hypothetical protein J7E68_06525 [Microbacterium sp. ISL-103]|uniref:hypothetical protein n=1 Tax=Microbacterium sp. ISL-103 TaxID=2819156 RepID=UPI001BE875EB|nr:hypothetical protein [Microbacterium sp. ISL-103]MBT2474241.1 hypothetical protein [Microbacterium sp. ISL-103]
MRKKIPERASVSMVILVFFVCAAIFGRNDFTVIVGLVGAALSSIWLTIELALATRS